ncbi:uncharacterized protein LOC113561976 [Ooceraea biroi]|uniref:uncharacterized protein LOC113561976 n=1 Tax=Ooceraea biroi TaxID=2015173 RepID=UPI000F09278D|nr:uncharacterized protein LOC113561976 [Ooceraea biroi]
MAKITDLPVEIIEIILDFNNISLQDFVRFSSTSKHFHQEMKYTSSFWRRKFNQRWPGVKKVCQIKMHERHLSIEEMEKLRVKCRKELRLVLARISENNYYDNCDRNLEEYDLILIHQPWPFYYSWNYCGNNVIVDEKELNLLVHPNDTTHHLNNYLLMVELTSLHNDLRNIYYGKQLLPYLKHYHLKNVWQEFISRPVQQQLLEEVAIFAAHWFHPEKEVSSLRLGMELDNIAQQVMESLKVVNPKHPMFLSSREQFLLWKYNNIIENQWNNDEGRQILNILIKILVGGLNCDVVAHSWKLLRKYLFMNYLIVNLSYYFERAKREHLNLSRNSYTKETHWCSRLLDLFIIFFISEKLKEVDTPEPIDNYIIGKYFCEFKDTYYMPNKMLANEYPDDILYLTTHTARVSKRCPKDNSFKRFLRHTDLKNFLRIYLTLWLLLATIVVLHKISVSLEL